MLQKKTDTIDVVFVVYSSSKVKKVFKLSPKRQSPCLDSLSLPVSSASRENKWSWRHENFSRENFSRFTRELTRDLNISRYAAWFYFLYLLVPLPTTLFRYKCHRWIFSSLLSNGGGSGKSVRLIFPIFRKTRPCLQRITVIPWRRRKAVPSEILENIFLYCVISVANQFVYDPFLAEFGRSASQGSPEADFRCHFGHFSISLLATYK